MTLAEDRGHRDISPLYAQRGWVDRVLGPPRLHGDGAELSGRIVTGPWLHWTGDTPAVGALGVLVDDVLGSSVIRCSSDEDLVWVTTEMTLDVLAAPPAVGTDLVGVAVCEHVDGTSGFASGRITAGGVLIATATERLRGRRLPAVPHERERVPDPGAVENLPGLLWPDGDVPSPRPDGSMPVVIGRRLVNMAGHLHGGIAFLLTEHLALATGNRDGARLTTASIHAVYLRPVLLGETCLLTAQTLHRGRTSGVVRVTAHTGQGKPAVVATVVLH